MSTILIINKDDFDLYLKNGLLNFKLDELQYLKIKRIFIKKENEKLILILIISIILYVQLTNSYIKLIFLSFSFILCYIRCTYKPLFSVNIIINCEKYNFEVEAEMIDEFFILEKKYMKIK